MANKSSFSEDEAKQLARDSRKSIEPFAVAGGQLVQQALRDNFPKLRAQAVLSGTGIAALTVTLTCNFNRDARGIDMLAQPAMMLPEATRSAVAIALGE